MSTSRCGRAGVRKVRAGPAVWVCWRTLTSCFFLGDNTEVSVIEGTAWAHGSHCLIMRALHHLCEDRGFRRSVWDWELSFISEVWPFWRIYFLSFNQAASHWDLCDSSKSCGEQSDLVDRMGLYPPPPPRPSHLTPLFASDKSNGYKTQLTPQYQLWAAGISHRLLSSSPVTFVPAWCLSFFIKGSEFIDRLLKSVFRWKAAAAESVLQRATKKQKQTK